MEFSSVCSAEMSSSDTKHYYYNLFGFSKRRDGRDFGILGSKFFPFEVDSFSEGHGVQKANEKLQKLSPLLQNCGKSTSLSKPLYH